MSSYQLAAHTLGKLEAPRRNNYYFSKMMDVLHFEMEQSHDLHALWMLNRLTFGKGVVCGLQVKAKDGKLCVTPGLAIDDYGRHVVVPIEVCVDPWLLPDACGQPNKELSRDAAHTVHLRVCYHECLTDFAPVLIGECNSKETCAAGTIVESFRFEIHEGKPDPVAGILPDGFCDKFLKAKATDRCEMLCVALSGGCAVPQGSGCVVLAVIELTADGKIGKIETCKHQTRVYSNAVLLELVLCLAQCCDKEHTPEPVALLQIKAVDFLDARGEVLQSLDPERGAPTLPAERMKAIKVTFSAPVEKTTVTAGGFGADPGKFSFLVQASWSDEAMNYVPGSIVFDAPTVVRFLIHEQLTMFRRGEYEVSIFGDANPPKRPAITGTNSVALDGAPSTLPSGDGAPGGSFHFKFQTT